MLSFVKTKSCEENEKDKYGCGNNLLYSTYIPSDQQNMGPLQNVITSRVFV